jgi:hypothetical protein
MSDRSKAIRERRRSEAEEMTSSCLVPSISERAGAQRLGGSAPAFMICCSGPLIWPLRACLPGQDLGP